MTVRVVINDVIDDASRRQTRWRVARGVGLALLLLAPPLVFGPRGDSFGRVGMILILMGTWLAVALWFAATRQRRRTALERAASAFGDAWVGLILARPDAVAKLGTLHGDPIKRIGRRAFDHATYELRTFIVIDDQGVRAEMPSIDGSPPLRCDLEHVEEVRLTLGSDGQPSHLALVGAGVHVARRLRRRPRSDGLPRGAIDLRGQSNV